MEIVPAEAIRHNYGNLDCKKVKFSIKDFFSKCEQICWKLRIWSHLPKKSLLENFIFCAVLDNKKNVIHNAVRKGLKYLLESA